MPPVDVTPYMENGSFELVYCAKAYNKIPVCEFKSKRTGLTVVIAEVYSSVVDGFFCLATEAFDDDGLPHTLEHLIFLGSENYPYKGVLDLLANRCLASGTNAWTDVDHTCYTMETAGHEGFLSLMPIYIDHILYPILSDEAFITEVHHVTGSGEDAGVVYCEMQGCENSGESRIHLNMQRIMYPGLCGYSSNTGGIMKNLRESTNNEKVRNYHQQFYRPENLKLIITGQIKPEDVFRALESIENKIVMKGARGPFTRPWQSTCPPVENSRDLVIKYASDDENNGMVTVSWRGPSAVTDLYSVTACTVLLKYLTDTAVAPLQKAFVEIEDPYASSVSYNLFENSETCLCLMFKNVPKDKLPLVKSQLDTVLKILVDNEEIDMKRMKSIINRHKLEYLSNLESSPHSAVAQLLIGHMLYGSTKDDLNQRINPLKDLEQANEEPRAYWLNLLTKWLIQNTVLSIQGVPSIEEQQKMSVEEKSRIDEQIAKLSTEGLEKCGKVLEDAIAFNEREPPEEMLTSVPIPSIASINFHKIARFCTASKTANAQIDLSETPIFTYFDHLDSCFVYMFTLMDTSNVPPQLRLFIPLLLEALFESPIERDGDIIPYEDVVAQLQDDTIMWGKQIGLSDVNSGRFKCGSYSQTVTVVLQVEPEKFERGIGWMRELLYKTAFTQERLKIIVTKMINDVACAKRSGGSMVRYLMRAMNYIPDSNQQIIGVLKQYNFLTQLIEKLDSNGAEVIDMLEKVRSVITDPSNVALYLATNLDSLQNNPAAVIQKFLLPDSNLVDKPQSLNVTPDWKLLAAHAERNNPTTCPSYCVIGMGCLESSEFQQSTPSINRYDHPDMPAILVFAQYLTQAEGPLWKQIRGKGFAYGYNIRLEVSEGLLYLTFMHATNVVGAYKEAHEIVSKQISNKQWDSNFLESAKCSLIYEFIQNDESIGSVVMHSLHTYFYQVDYEYNRHLLHLINKVTIDDLNRVGEKYFTPLFDPASVKTAIVCDPSKTEEIASGFKQFNIELAVYPSLEESFLNNI